MFHVDSFSKQKFNLTQCVWETDCLTKHDWTGAKQGMENQNTFLMAIDIQMALKMNNKYCSLEVTN